jgi:hypothetical protein
MSDRLKNRLLIAAVVILVAAAAITGFRSMRSTAQPTVSPDFARLSATEQQKLLDQAERDRRAVGKQPARRLPEDPPGFNPPPQ